MLTRVSTNQCVAAWFVLYLSWRLVPMIHGYVIRTHVWRTKVMEVMDKSDYRGGEATKWGAGECGVGVRVSVYVWGGNSERWWLWRFRMYKVRKGLRGARVGGWVYVLWCWLTTVVQWSPNPSSLCEVNKLGFGYPSNTCFILYCCWVSSRFFARYKCVGIR